MSRISSYSCQIPWINFRLNWGHNMYPRSSLRPPIHHCVRTTLSRASIFLSLHWIFFFYLLESIDLTHQMTRFFLVFFKFSYLLKFYIWNFLFSILGLTQISCFHSFLLLFEHTLHQKFFLFRLVFFFEQKLCFLPYQ